MTGMTDLEFRPLREEEFAEAVELDSIAFAEQHQPEDVPAFKKAFDFGRSYCAFDEGRLVGVMSALTLELTLPGGQPLPVSGLTWAAVLPTHRRRGILTRLMRFQLEDAVRRREAGAVLIASEGSIYGRFGFGPATGFQTLSVDRVDGAFRRPVSREGRLDLLSAAQAADLLPLIYDRIRRTQPGEVSRSAEAWQEHLRDAEREDAGPMLHVSHATADGDCDGYVSYRVKEQWTGWLAANEVRVVEMMAPNAEAYARLWEYLLTLDLTSGVVFETARVDEPLRWLLSDARAVRVQALGDYLWLRLLDLPRALAARAYGARGDLVFEIEESFPLIRRSRLLLSVGEPGGPARCAPTDRPPQLRLDVAALSAAFLGGVSFATLAAATRVHPVDPEAVEHADSLFATPRAPYCTTMF